MPGKPVEQLRPEVLVLLVADYVHTDPATGKHYIMGTYDSIAGTAFPMVYPAIVVYGAITNGHGAFRVGIRLVDADDAQEPLFENYAGLDLQDPLMVAQFITAAPNVVFPKPGDYVIQLHAAGHLLRERRLFVREAPGTR